MPDNISTVLSKYLKEVNGVRCFLGDDSIQEDFEASVVFAQKCPFYKVDEEEEIYSEGILTCYNCRYRRWIRSGFSCFKSFPLG